MDILNKSKISWTKNKQIRWAMPTLGLIISLTTFKQRFYATTQSYSSTPA